MLPCWLKDTETDRDTYTEREEDVQDEEASGVGDKEKEEEAWREGGGTSKGGEKEIMR